MTLHAFILYGDVGACIHYYIPLLHCCYVQYKQYKVATGNHSAIWIAASNYSAIWITGSTAIDLVTVYGWLWRLQ